MRKFKKLLLIFSVLVLCLSVPNCASAAVKLSSKKITITAGKTKTLKIKGTKKKVKWKSNNKKIATVTNKGKVKGIKAGSCKITATVGGKKYTCSVKVTAKKTSTKSPTMGQKNALDSAKKYLNYSAFSREGLINQLEFERFSKSEAEYAVDNCGANWNKQATKKAKQYLDYSAFSRQGLIEQLEYEKFTPGEAEYGVKYCGADWYEQAAKKAKQYLQYSSFSKDGLISQLEFEKFTHEEAVYGVEQNWY